MKKGAAIAAVLGVLLGIWGYWFYSRPYDAVRLVQCLPQDRSLHVYLNVGLLRSAGILDLLAGSQGTEEADYKKFVEQTGFDYRTDLDAVAAGFRDGDEYFAVQGRFKWDRLADYAQSHQGKCEVGQSGGTCSMPASQPGKTISFSLLRRDVLAMAVARDPQASRVIFPGFWKDPPTIPTAAIWVSAPPYVFADAKTLARRLGSVPDAARAGARHGIHLGTGSGSKDRSESLRSAHDRGLHRSRRRHQDGRAVFERNRFAQEDARPRQAQAGCGRSQRQS